jgi:leucyl aminopeptidase
MITEDSDTGEDSVTDTTGQVVQKERPKTRSWVYEFSEKLETNGKSYFHCCYEFKNGRKCTYKVQTKNGQTTGIANHLKIKHNLKAKNLVQTTLTLDNMPPNKPTPKTFRQAFAELVAKQYLPFSIVEEKVVQDSYLAFHNEWAKTK